MGNKKNNMTSIIAKLTICLVVCLYFNKPSMADAIIFDDGQVHDINYPLQVWDVHIYDDSNNSPTTVNFLTGSSNIKTVYVYNFSQFNNLGGSVGWGVYAQNDSQVMISEGAIGTRITATNNSKTRAVMKKR